MRSSASWAAAAWGSSTWLGNVALDRPVRAQDDPGRVASPVERTWRGSGPRPRRSPRLQHPDIVQIYDVGEADGLPFLELEYLPGGSLERTLDGTPRPAAEAAQLVETLARAIADAHQQGIVHRDLKPANILMTSSGQPKMADFGLAKFARLRARPDRTNQSSARRATWPRSRPRAARTGRPAADVYALGAILYELLTGRPPFRAATALETLAGQGDRAGAAVAAPAGPAARPRDDLPEMPGEGPGAALRQCRALAEDLRRFLAGEPILARPAPVWERAWKWARGGRRRRGPGHRAAATGSLIGGVLYHGSQLRDANVRLAKALQQARSAEGIARAAKEQAQANAKTADAQRDLALKALLELANGVQNKLKTSPDTLALRQSLLDTAIAGLGEIARSTEAAAPNLGRAIAHQKLADVYRQVGRAPELTGRLRAFPRAGEGPRRSIVRRPRRPGMPGRGLLPAGFPQPDARPAARGRGPLPAGVAGVRGSGSPRSDASAIPRIWIRNSLQLGHSLFWRNARPEALAAFGSTLELARRWAADDMANPMARNLIGEVHIELGDTYSCSSATSVGPDTYYSRRSPSAGRCGRRFGQPPGSVRPDNGPP